MTKEVFIVAATAAARESSATSGLPPGVTVAQAALERAWGRSQLARQANNYFGIKARAGAPEFAEFPTWELMDGKPVRVTARFARFDSMAACFRERDRMINQLPAYAQAKLAAADAEAFIRALARRWATDPRYAEKLLGIYREAGLAQLDAPPAQD